jgi:hypothetical protein
MWHEQSRAVGLGNSRKTERRALMWTPLSSRIAATTVISILLAGGAWYAHSSGKRSGTAATQAQWNIERLASQTARANQEARHRLIEQELNDAIEIHAQEIAAANAARTADRAAGAVVAVRLRDAARATAALAGQTRADATAAGVREAAADAARVLAYLREESDERSGILARALDDAHFAGAACQRRYAEVREAINR